MLEIPPPTSFPGIACQACSWAAFRARNAAPGGRSGPSRERDVESAEAAPRSGAHARPLEEVQVIRDRGGARALASAPGAWL